MLKHSASFKEMELQDLVFFRWQGKSELRNLGTKESQGQVRVQLLLLFPTRAKYLLSHGRVGISKCY